MLQGKEAGELRLRVPLGREAKRRSGPVMVQHATSAGQTIGDVMARGRASVASKSDARYVISLSPHPVAPDLVSLVFFVFSVAVWFYFSGILFFLHPSKSNLN